MKLVIEIDLSGPLSSNSTAGRDREVAEILQRLGRRIGHPAVGIETVNCEPVLDAHGNTVGEVYLEDRSR
jgi:hypothetical protein